VPRWARGAAGLGAPGGGGGSARRQPSAPRPL